MGKLPTAPVPIRDKNLFWHNSSCSIHRFEHPKYLLLQLKNENLHCLNYPKITQIFLNVKPVLQKAWPLVPNYFQPLCKEGHSFLEDDIFLNQRQFIIITLHFFGPKSCHHEMIFSWTKQKSTWVSKWQSAVKRIKWWKIKGSPLASRFCQSCHLPLDKDN